MGRRNYGFSPNFVQIMAKLFLLVGILIGSLVLPATAQNPSGVKPGTAPTTSKSGGVPTTAKPGGAPATVKPGPARLAPTGTPTLADTAIKFADSIFHTPSILYEEVETGIPPDIKPILVRFNNALVANRNWFEQYKTTYAGQPLPYNQRFGISFEEFRRLQSFTPQPVPVDTQKVNIIREAGYIRFHGVDSNFQLLDYMQIDCKKQLVVYGADTIPLVGRTATTANSPYGEWQGFTWRLEKADAANTLATGQVTARVIEINMGLTVQPARVFLRVKYQQMKEGTTTANLEMAGFVQH
jgi:hypothetical protein